VNRMRRIRAGVLSVTVLLVAACVALVATSSTDRAVASVALIGVTSTYDAAPQDLFATQSDSDGSGREPGTGIQHDTSWVAELLAVQPVFVAAETADAIPGLSNTYVDITKGSSIGNVGTDATHDGFAANLSNGGWTSSASKDGAVQIFQRGGAKYVLRSKNSSGYPGWTADFTPAGSTQHMLEIRLGYTP
jgi:hypothetical protein